ncbi:MAG: sigma-70 family RNA polymerase sigma factor [Acidobacteria bacterium]|nr:sigma-70 family RNA polymerase sigma factor [Acidobacteriota bacterium]
MQSPAATAPNSQSHVRDLARTETDRQLTALLVAIAQGKQEAFTDFYDQSNRLVFSLALRILNDRGLAEEVTTDVYMQVWRQAGNFEAVRGTPLSWLMTIARTRSIDRLRSSSHLRQETESLDVVMHHAVTADNPERNTLYTERQKLVRAALNQLLPEQRRLIESAYFEGLSQSELAEKFNLPLGTVKTRVRAGMLVLKNYLSAQFLES